MRIKNLKDIKGIKYDLGNYSDHEIELTTDSRNVTGKNVFLALVGEKFDGFDYLASLLDSSIEVFIYEDKPGRKEIVSKLNSQNKLFIAVENSLKYLQDAAAFHGEEWKRNGGKVLALTGSNGKTTTKEILFQFAKAIFGDQSICTAGNLNNHIGVPLTLFSLKSHHKFAIVEMGTNHHGEIEVLADIVNPHFGLITNIGAAHLEFLGSEEGVFEEKTALLRNLLKNNGLFFKNSLDKHLKNIEETKNVIAFTGEIPDLVNGLIKESYNIHNLNFAYFIFKSLFPSEIEKLNSAYVTIKLPDNKRSQWIEKGENKIFLDAYNANPSSMKESIRSYAKVLGSECEQALLICGDMNELGELAKDYHREVGQLIKELGFKHAAFVGRYSEFYKLGFGESGLYFKTKEELVSKYKELKIKHRYLFIKASRSLQLESLLDIN